MALNAYEHAVRSNPCPTAAAAIASSMPTIVDAADLPRFGALGVIASMQPASGNPTPARIELLVDERWSGARVAGVAYGSISRRAARSRSAATGRTRRSTRCSACTRP